MPSCDATMDAVVMGDFGGPEVLALARVPLPVPGPGEVLVRVEAVTINSTRDVLTRTGNGPFSRFVTPPHILGAEHAGWVDAVGERVDPSLVGRRVAVHSASYCGTCAGCADGVQADCSDLRLLGIHRQGSYAEYAVASAAGVYELPDDLSFVEATALLTSGPVAHAQVRAAAVAPGATLVVSGVSGALGSMVAQLASARGARVIGLARDVARAQALPLTADVILDATAGDLERRLRDTCGAAGASAVIDNICQSPGWDAALAVLGRRGRVVISGTFGSGRAVIDTRWLYLNNQSVLGVRSCDIVDQRDFWEMVRGGLRLPTGLIETFPLASAADAHRAVERGAKRGYFVLTTAD
jgi:D-arabinose 1-dehydrogenase-like Zn-dependent alcohol dehydrogenase